MKVTRGENRWHALFLKASLAAVGVGRGLSSEPIAADAATRGGKMVYARYADSLFLDPVLNDANVDIWVLTNLYDTLLQPDRRTASASSPASPPSGSSRDDGKSLTLTLRQGVKFADGSALTAQDVKWSLDRARDPKAGAWTSSLASIDVGRRRRSPTRSSSSSSTPTRR